MRSSGAPGKPTGTTSKFAHAIALGILVSHCRSSHAVIFGHLLVPTTSVDVSQGPVTFIDQSLCFDQAVEVRSVEFFSPRPQISSREDCRFFMQIWRPLWPVNDEGLPLQELVVQVELFKSSTPGSVFSALLTVLADAGDCVGWSYNCEEGGIIGFDEADGEDQIIYLTRPSGWPLDSGDQIWVHKQLHRKYSLRVEWEPRGCWEDGRSWSACCNSDSGAQASCWPMQGNVNVSVLFEDCCREVAGGAAFSEPLSACNDCVPLVWRQFPDMLDVWDRSLERGHAYAATGMSLLEPCCKYSGLRTSALPSVSACWPTRCSELCCGLTQNQSLFLASRVSSAQYHRRAAAENTSTLKSSASIKSTQVICIDTGQPTTWCEYTDLCLGEHGLIWLDSILPQNTEVRYPPDQLVHSLGVTDRKLHTLDGLDRISERRFPLGARFPGNVRTAHSISNGIWSDPADATLLVGLWGGTAAWAVNLKHWAQFAIAIFVARWHMAKSRLFPGHSAPNTNTFFGLSKEKIGQLPSYNRVLIFDRYGVLHRPWNVGLLKLVLGHEDFQVVTPDSSYAQAVGGALPQCFPYVTIPGVASQLLPGIAVAQRWRLSVASFFKPPILFKKQTILFFWRVDDRRVVSPTGEQLTSLLSSAMWSLNSEFASPADAASSINFVTWGQHTPFTTYVRGLSTAAVFIAVTGAALTNVLFMPPDSVLLEIAAYIDWDYESNALHAAVFFLRYRLRAQEVVRTGSTGLYSTEFEEWSDGACWSSVDCSSGRGYDVSLNPGRFSETFGEAYSLAVPFRKRWPGDAWREALSHLRG